MNSKLKMLGKMFINQTVNEKMYVFDDYKFKEEDKSISINGVNDRKNWNKVTIWFYFNE